ncbi:hypothetical protein FXO38_09963 [Capsicum annuum]|nr:hypothetical protein FXO38_09963 [Capsicum annuum]
MKKLRQNHAKKYMKKNGSKKRGSNSPASKAPAKRRRIVEAIFRDELPKVKMFECTKTRGVGKFFVRDEDGASMGPLLALLQDKVFSNSCHCLKLLKNCYKALPDNGKVIVVEANLPAKPDTDTTVIGASQVRRFLPYFLLSSSHSPTIVAPVDDTAPATIVALVDDVAPKKSEYMRYLSEFDSPSLHGSNLSKFGSKKWREEDKRREPMGWVLEMNCDASS